MRKLKLITRFYSGIFVANILVTFSCLFIIGFYQAKGIEIIGILFWFKISTLFAIFYLSVLYRKHELYYYQNLGISKLLLGISTSIFDFSLWLILIIEIL